MRARKLLARLGLGERLDHRPNQLSGGQQQRVSIARALMNGGAIILADEPTGALDSRTGREMMEVLLDLNRRGHTLIIATHDAHVAAYARRVVEIEDGRVIRDEQTEGAAPASPPTALDDMRAPPPSAGAAALWPRLVEAIKMAWFALLGQRLRTALTLLGVIIGIVSVVMMVALGESSQRVLREQLKDMPANFLEITPGKFWGDPDATKLQSLTAADVDVLRRQSFIHSITPEVTASAMLRLGSLNSNATVSGGNEDYFETSGLRFEMGAGLQRSGRFGAATGRGDRPQCRERQFFGDQNPLGKILNVGKLPCIVIGVVAKNLTMESPGAANRLDVYMPFTTVGARLLGNSRLNYVEMRFRDGLPGEAVERGVEDILTRRHHVKDFSIYNMERWVQSKKVFTDTTTYLLGAIGLVSLIVGGIGVMNIMLVSVSERAREIGIRMAVGARRSDVRSQFLTEAVVVCLIGGAAGVIISFGVSYLASFFLPTQWQLALSPTAVAAAVASASLTGIIFGYIPARNASTLDPVEALSRD